MELKLESLIKDVEIITNIHNQNKNPIMYRIQNGATNQGLVFFCGYAIPRYVVLPRNAVYFDYNPESTTYRCALQRKVKHTDPHSDVWEVLYFYADAMAEQEYDPEDLEVISPKMPDVATNITHGIGYLSSPQKHSHVLVEGDPTLSDDRDPLPHMEMHPEIPATMIGINRSQGVDFLPILDQANPEVGQVLVHRESTMQWSKVHESELIK